MARKAVVIDFETEAIQPRPKYPPKPVGVAIGDPGKKPQYLAWGHPAENNTTKEDAARILKSYWDDQNVDIVCQHGKFDIDVAEIHLGLKMPSWQRLHDTLFLLFLEDPHARSLSLKPSAERLLKMKPEEQTAVRDWLLKNKPVRGINKDNWGAYICLAPGKLVGKYAVGDVVRTDRLFRRGLPIIQKRNMMEAYDRERKLQPILIRNEREGIHVDFMRLLSDVLAYEKQLQRTDEWLRKKLKLGPSANIGSDDVLADALEARRYVKEWEYTNKGNRKVSIPSLKNTLADKELLGVLAYRSRLSTSLSTFMQPWLKMACLTGGYIHTTWNQVRGDKGGARTGRIQSSPNFQNIIKELDEQDYLKLMGPAKSVLRHWLPLPNVRGYILADPGHLLLNRDYSQQELRILGHFEDGVLLEAYNKDPKLDMHKLAQQLINKMLNANFERKPIKNTGFGLLYGMGLDLLAEKTGTDRRTAGKLKNAYLSIFPGLRDLDDGLKSRGAEGKPIRTWGGREYYVEEPKYIEKYQRTMTFEYKLLNYLIQGSAADCTKQAIINYDETRPESRGARFLLSVHDEIMATGPKAEAKRELQILRAAMSDVKFDVPMLSDGRIGPTWAKLADVKEK